MGKKKLNIDHHIILNDAKRINNNLKPLRNKLGLAKALKADFPKSTHLYKQIVRLEMEPFDRKFNKDLVVSICKILNTTEAEIIVECE